MKGLDFLKNAKLATNEAVKPATARTTAAKSRNPENADIRVYKNGAVYPSATLVAEFDLNYVAKDVTAKGNAFDVFKSTDYPYITLEGKVILIAASDRAEGKADLFGRTTYDESGAPSDVMSQGATTFGLELLEYAKEVYDESIAEAVEGEPVPNNYIDFVILRDTPFNTDNGIYFIPKTVSRGADKGKSVVVRRENITLFPLVPKSWVDESTSSEPAAVEPEEVEAPLGEVEADEELAAAPVAKAGK